MANSVDLHLNIQNGLEQSVNKSRKSMDQFNDVASKVNKTAEKVNDQFDDMNDSLDKANKRAGRLQGAFQKLGQTIKSLLGPIASLFAIGGIVDFTKTVLGADQAMRDLSFRMGQGGKTASDLTQSIYDVTQATGESIENSQKLITTLKEFRIADQYVKEMAIDTARFSDITGATSESAAQLTGRLMTTGQLGSKATSSVLAGIVKVQREFGLTVNEVENLTDTLVSTTQTLSQLGKSADDIEKFSKGTTELAAAFSEVGLEAQEATKIIERLLDPSQIEDNALLYSKLGISIQDAISGNIDPQQVRQGLQSLGTELSNMNQIAASQLARSMGMSLNQLRQMSELPLDEVSASLGGAADASAYMAEEQAKQEGPMDKMQKTFERIKATLGTVVNQFMPVFESIFGVITKHADSITGAIQKFISGGGIKKIAEQIGKVINLLKDPKLLIALIGGILLFFRMFRRKFRSVATDSGEQLKTSVAEGVSAGLQMGVEKGMEQASRKSKRGATSLATGEDAGMGGHQDARAALNARMGERLRLLQQQRTVTEETLNTERQAQEEILSRYRNRYNTLQDIEESQGLSVSQMWEMNKLAKEMGKVEKELKIDASEVKEAARLQKVERKILLTMSREELTIRQRDLETQQQQVQEAVNAQRAIQQQMETELKMVNERKSGLQAMQSAMMKDVQAGMTRNDLVDKYKMDLTQVRKELSEQNRLADELGNEYNQATSEIQKQEKLLGEMREETEKVGDALRKRGGAADIDKMFDSPLDRFKGFFAKAGGAIAEKFRFGGRKIGNEMEDAGKKSGRVFGRIFRSAGTDVADDISKATKRGGGLGGLGKLVAIAGPVMMIGRMLMKMQPVQEAIQKVMKAVKPIISKLGEIFGKVFGEIAQALMPILELLFEKVLIPLVKLLLPPLLKVLGFLLQILGSLISALGQVIKALTFGALGDGIIEMGDEISAAGKNMVNAANALGQEFEKERQNRKQLEEVQKARQNIEMQMEAQGYSLDRDSIEQLSTNKEAMSSLEDAVNANVDILRKNAEDQGFDATYDLVEQLRGTLKQQIDADRERLKRQFRAGTIDATQYQTELTASSRLAAEKVLQGDLAQGLREKGIDLEISDLLSRFGTVRRTGKMYEKLDEGGQLTDMGAEIASGILESLKIDPTTGMTVNAAETYKALLEEEERLRNELETTGMTEQEGYTDVTAETGGGIGGGVTTAGSGPNAPVLLRATSTGINIAEEQQATMDESQLQAAQKQNELLEKVYTIIEKQYDINTLSAEQMEVLIEQVMANRGNLKGSNQE